VVFDESAFEIPLKCVVLIWPRISFGTLVFPTSVFQVRRRPRFVASGMTPRPRCARRSCRACPWPLRLRGLYSATVAPAELRIGPFSSRALDARRRSVPEGERASAAGSSGSAQKNHQSEVPGVVVSATRLSLQTTFECRSSSLNRCINTK
jgi:hypothetical protein